MVDQITEEAGLCTLEPLHESNGGECVLDDNEQTPVQNDLRPYVDQVR